MFFDLNINTTDASNLVSLLEQEVKRALSSRPSNLCFGAYLLAVGYSAIALNVTVAGRIQSEHVRTPLSVLTHPHRSCVSSRRVRLLLSLRPLGF